MEIKVLEVLEGDRAIVSTKGLRRVVLVSTGEVLSEMLPERMAERYARGWNRGGQIVAKPVRYSA